ncbi:Class III cytochrome C family protein [Novipirellula aureliae]|uniref:Class III cytochrome C family protein n=1 Tax=Novipirellula aureliae TaxID=2527966 RepID=A0A5C6EAQ5_9BACT|nr:cytochrome c3 family protein [Novipirellula aureliae]TWU45820.1 Class III cytochrome C family protein [Novipirellula aureliae]
MVEASEGDPIEGDRFHFPRWANYLFPTTLIVAIGLLTYVPLLFTLLISPETRSVGYQPKQPIAFSHAIHVGKMQMDCRYCHSTVETASFAAIPPTQTCLNCHASIKSESELLKPMRDSFEKATPVSWTKVHDLPDFVYFNHSAHVNKGVACVTCHGQINEMEEVEQVQPLSMTWCLGCHRNPEPNIRPLSEVTNMNWDAVSATGKTSAELGKELASEYHVQSPPFMTSCTTCHR